MNWASYPVEEVTANGQHCVVKTALPALAPSRAIQRAIETGTAKRLRSSIIYMRLRFPRWHPRAPYKEPSSAPAAQGPARGLTVCRISLPCSIDSEPFPALTVRAISFRRKLVAHLIARAQGTSGT